MDSPEKAERKLFNSAVFLIPGPEIEDDEAIFMSAIAENDELSGDVPKIEDVLPENWDGKYVPHLWEIEKVVGDMQASPNFGTKPDMLDTMRKEEGVTHLVILESPVIPPDSHPFKLGATEIKGNSMMILYDANRQMYRLFHCGRCAYTFAKWLEEKQPSWWDVDSPEFQAKKPSYN